MIRSLFVALSRALSLIAVLATGLIVAGDTVVAQQGDTDLGSYSEATGGTVLAGSSNENVGAVPAALPLPKQHFVGSVMYKRTVGMERFDTDHDIDGTDGVDREIFGSYYVMGNEFKVRIPARYSDKPEGVFGFSFNHIVFEVGSSRFTADCARPRTYLYSGTNSWRWICSLDFGSEVNSWNSAISTASEIKIVAFWSDEECKEEGAYGIKDKEDLLERDCETLLAIKHYWLDKVVLDSVAGNRDRLPKDHALFSWGVGDIEKWSGVLVDDFPNDNKSLRKGCEGDNKNCSRRVIVVDLGVDVNGRDSKKIKGGIPAEFGDLKALVALNLYNNLLSGAIPAELGNDEFAPCHKSTRTPELYLIVVTIDLGEYNIPVNADDCRQNSESRVTREELESSEFTRSLTSSPVATSGGGTVASVSAKTVMPKVGLFSNTDSNGNQTFNLKAVSKYSKNIAKDLDVIAENFVKKGSKAFKALRVLNVALNRFALFVDGLFFVESITRVEHYEYLEYGRSQLKFLDLSRNALSGQIPASLGKLNKLRFLYLNDNYLAGALPSGIGMGGRIDGTYDSLVHLNASNNQLSGQIPNGLSMALEYIDLGYNQLTGIIPWESIGRLYLLAGLYLNNNRNLVLGDIPEPSGLVSYAWPDYPAVSSAAPGHYDNLNLTYLDLSNNSFSGAVPDGIFKFWGLKELSLNGNNFVALSDGSSDNLIGYWMFLNLRRLDLSYNNFLSIPGFGKLERLTYFNFSGNKLDNSNDSLKSFLRNTNIWRLEYVDLSNNLILYVPEPIDFLALTHLYFNDNCLVSAARDWISDEGYAKLIEFDESNNYFNQTDATPVKEECGEIGDCENGKFVRFPVLQRGLVEDCLVLVALRDRWLNTSASSVLSGWGKDNQKKIQEWAGVTVSNNRVEGLNFSDLGIVDTVPEQIFQLGKLRDLNLSSNKLFGNLPEGLGDLGNLRTLDMSNNSLTGSVPVGLLYLYRLTDLDLSNNMLSGEIPVGVTQGFISIVNLNLSHNQLTGNLPDMCLSLSELKCLDFRLLKTLDLSHNLLTGKIPFSYVALNDDFSFEAFRGRLENAQLNNNCLTIIDDKGDTLEVVNILKDILKGENKSFSVEDNPAGAECPGRGGCSGGVLVEKPDEDAELVADCEVLLELLEAWSGDALGDWGTEEISEWTGVEVFGGRVTELSLENQRVAGLVPAVIGDLGGLKVLDLSGNRLRGALPSEVGNLSVLTDLDLSGNNLSGGLPSGLGRLGKLERLDLSGNGFSGGVPSGLGRLGSLTDLDLSDNRLSGAIPAVSGRIPAGLGRLASLEVLDLSGNRL